MQPLRFFDAHPIFAVTNPAPWTYGKQARVHDRGISRGITWSDARDHGITVRRVLVNTRDKLAVLDDGNRRFVFEPMTVPFWRRRYPHLAHLDTVEKIEAAIRAEYAWP